jgi:hypothetical protein
MVELIAEKMDAVLCPKFGHHVLVKMCGHGCQCDGGTIYSGHKTRQQCSFTLSDREIKDATMYERSEIKVEETAWMLNDKGGD